ncbi:MAG TPA: PDR/VanB family oxidoreductase [Mycobacterium sp.]|nr:PDR/VanB family oxidoreductase [Mycobacterium sp.]
MTTPRHKLLITQITHQAHGVVAVELRDPQGAELPRWEPGAHIDLHLPSGLVRQYSLCSDPEDRAQYRVAVLRAPDSRGGSAEVHDTDLEGRMLEISGPRNHFALCEAQDYLLIAGGIGVTPILAMARELTKRRRRWSMIYGGRARTSMAFTAELVELDGHVDVVPQDERGLPDLDTAIRACQPGTAVYCCGPEPMLQAVQSLCAQHLPAGALHIERFAAAATAGEARTEDHEFEVELARSGQVLTVPADRTVLDAVLDVLPGTPYSCREGYCGTCESAVLEGVPEHRDDVLTEDEQAAGDTMMICVSRSKSPRLVLDL